MTSTSDFQRARSEEQRAQRRRAILETAAAMLTEMPVAQVSLNELSRRVGLAKSNVLRYFESREAVLLDLLDTATRSWLEDLATRLPAAVEGTADPYARTDRLAATLAASLAERPVLCDLAGAQASVLERNVSEEVAIRYKRASLDGLQALAALVGSALPELDERDTVRLASATLLVAGAMWVHAHPSDAVLAAYASDPALAAMRLPFEEAVRLSVSVFGSGLLARRQDGGAGRSAQAAAGQGQPQP
jgi:AcrR family transcriptional regulator